MEEKRWESCNAEALLDEFFSQDDLRQLALSTGELLGCPLLVLDDTFHGAAHHLPLGFSDALFETAVRCGEITYEAGAIISKNAMLTAGWADYVQLADSPLSAAFCTSHQRGRAPRLPHLRGYGRTFGKDSAANLGAGGAHPLQAAVHGGEPSGQVFRDGGGHPHAPAGRRVFLRRALPASGVRHLPGGFPPADLCPHRP